jgi:hypothetical protein
MNANASNSAAVARFGVQVLFLIGLFGEWGGSGSFHQREIRHFE